MLARLAQSGGAPQTLGEYMDSGPRQLPADLISGASGDFLSSASGPHAFKPGAGTVTSKPSSPSTFQDIASLIPLLLMANQIGQGSQLSAQDQMMAKILGIDPKTLQGGASNYGLIGKMLGLGGASADSTPSAAGGGLDLSSIYTPGGAGADTSSYYSNVGAGAGSGGLMDGGDWFGGDGFTY